VVSLLVLAVALDRSGTNSNLVFAWIFLLALSVLLPKAVSDKSTNTTKFVKRLEYGALGGGIFWSLVFVVHFGSTTSIEGSMLWTAIIFLVGLLSWMREVPNPSASDNINGSDLFNLGMRSSVQLLLTFIYIYPL
jgi:hypothetical protein